jgi:hypothetical protein
MRANTWQRAVRLLLAAGVLAAAVLPAAAQSAAAPRPQDRPMVPAQGVAGVLVGDLDDLRAPAQPPVRPPASFTPTSGARTPGVDPLAPPAVPTRWLAPKPAAPAAIPAAKAPAPPAKAVPTPAPLPVLKQASTPAPTPAVPPVRDVSAKPVLLGADVPPIYPARKWPPAHKVSPAKGVSSAPAGVPAAPAAAPANTSAIPEHPSITVGRILIENAPPAGPAPRAASKLIPAGLLSRPSGTAPDTSGQLKRHVQAACGNLARSVQVLPQGSQGTLVKVRVDNAALQSQVTTRLMALPEMASPQVRLEVEVGK